MTCYYAAMRAQIERSLSRPGKVYFYPEEYKYLKTREEPCNLRRCPHWPRFTVVAGSPHLPYYRQPGEPESLRYKCAEWLRTVSSFLPSRKLETLGNDILSINYRQDTWQLSTKLWYLAIRVENRHRKYWP